MIASKVRRFGHLAMLFVAFVLATHTLGEEVSDSNGRTNGFAGWPHLRGPFYDGTSKETGLLDVWPVGGLPMLWNIELGHGYSGFVVAEGRAYTQVQTLTGQFVVCLNADTGAKIWEYRYDWPYEAGGVCPGPRATPTLAGGRILTAGPRGQVVCLQASDGHELWSVDVKAKFKGRGYDFGYSSSPLVEADKVILPVGGSGASVVALDAKTGATVWQSGDEPASYSSAIPIVFHGQRQILALLRNALAGFDLQTGRLLWQYKLPPGYSEHSTFPLYSEPFVMMASPFHEGAKLFRLEPDAKEPKRVWDTQELSQDAVSSVLVDGHVYGFDLHDVQVKAQRPSSGEFKCLDFLTGQVRWATNQTGLASVIAADGKLILFNDQGELILARVNPARYEELSRVSIFPGEICWTAPALAHGRIYLRTQTRAACLDLAQPGKSNRVAKHVAHTSATVSRPSAAKYHYWFLGGEPDYLFEPPEMQDFTRWFAYSMGIIGIAAAIAILVGAFQRNHNATVFVFSVTALILGIVAMPLVNRWSSAFVFTWPVNLFVMFQVTVLAILWADRQPDRKRSRRISRFVGFLFLGACFGYYLVCRRLSLIQEWTYLIGFLPAAPFAFLAARGILRGPRRLSNVVWFTFAFAAYYWSSSIFLYLR